MIFIDRFANPAALQLLWCIPVLLVVSWRMKLRSQKKMKAVFGTALMSSGSLKRQNVKLGLEIFFLTLLVVALARPQRGETKQKIKTEGTEIMLLIDVSQSMMSEDVRPSRLELSKKELNKFIDLVGGDKVGLVAFAGTAVTLSPLTTDKSALKMFLDSLSPTTVSTQGTDFRRALVEAKNAFERGGVEGGTETLVTRLVVVVSDGEDNETGASDVVHELTGKGIRLFTLAVGTESGGTIPVRDDRGNIVGTLHDKNGQEVITKVSGDSLRDLAKEGRGSFYYITIGGDAIPSLLKDVNQLQKSIFADTEIISYRESYQFFILTALIFGLGAFLFSERKKGLTPWRGRFEGTP
ncbi:MAG: VWA domain-containing protein [Bdellovibrionales bacterium]|nr:VWA domain-containing protein [Bdellovibrionales bacterium]